MTQITSSTFAGYFGENLRTNAAVFKYPQVWAKYGNLYGSQARLLNFLRMTGGTTTVESADMTYYFSGSWDRSIKVKTFTTTGVAGSSPTFVLVSGQTQTINGTVFKPIQKDQVIVIPPYYTNKITPSNFVVTDVGDGTANAIYTIKPLDATVTISRSIADNTELMIGGTMHSRGSGAPDGKFDQEYSRTFTSQIVRSSLNIEGAIPAMKLWRDTLEGGGSNTLIRGTERTQYEQDNQIELALLLGELNDNSVTTTNNRGASARNVLGTQGVLSWMDAEAQEMPYNANFNIGDLDAIKTFLELKRLSEREVNVFAGSRFCTRMEGAAYNFIKEFGATDVMADAMKLGLSINKFQKNGVTVNLVELPEFSDPASFGLPNYPFPDYALIFPNTQSMVSTVKGGEKSLVINSLTCGYVKYGGEDRTRVIGKVNGMTGIADFGAHVTEYDDADLHILTEMMVIFTEPEKSILAYLE